MILVRREDGDAGAGESLWVFSPSGRRRGRIARYSMP